VPNRLAAKDRAIRGGGPYRFSGSPPGPFGIGGRSGSRLEPPPETAAAASARPKRSVFVELEPPPETAAAARGRPAFRQCWPIRGRRADGPADDAPEPDRPAGKRSSEC